MFAHYAVRRNITHEVNISDKVNISCPQGKHRSKKPNTNVLGFFVAGDEGFEPSQTESESVVLPLHKSPMFCFALCDGYYYSKVSLSCQVYFYKKSRKYTTFFKILFLLALFVP